MLVNARCTAPAWDSERAKFYYPGETYEIETTSPLADLKRGKDEYVFEFDRASPLAPREYKCEKCGKDCKTLNGLGTHVHSEHPEGVAEPEEEEVFADRTCSCGKVCKTPYGLKVHQRKTGHKAEAKAAA
jgi:hypothetical protein